MREGDPGRRIQFISRAMRRLDSLRPLHIRREKTDREALCPNRNASGGPRRVMRFPRG